MGAIEKLTCHEDLPHISFGQINIRKVKISEGKSMLKLKTNMKINIEWDLT